MPVKLPKGLTKMVQGALRYVPSRSEHGRPIVTLRIVRGGDKFNMLQAANSMQCRNTIDRLILMPLSVRGRLTIRDDAHLYNLEFNTLRLSVNVDELLFDEDGFWAMYGQIVDHDRIYPGLELRHCDYSASYNPSHRRGRIYIALPGVTGDAA